MRWKNLSKEKRIKLIDRVLDEDIRPFVERDGGGVEIGDIVNDNQVIIVYQGACQGCPAAKGGTLSYIEEVLKEKVHKNITVIPQ